MELSDLDSELAPLRAGRGRTRTLKRGAMQVRHIA